MRSRTVLKLGLFAAMAATAASLGGLFSPSSASADGATVTIDPFQAGPGDVRSIDLQVLGVGEPGLGAWTIDVHYDPAALTIEDCDAEFGGVCNPAFSAGSARIVGTSVNGATGDPILGSLSFSCDAVGQSAIELSIDVLADATPGGPLPVAAKTVNATATCTEEPSPPPPVPGDVDCDGDVDTIDAVLVLQYVASMIESLDCLDNADANEDNVVDAVDASIILQIAAGLLD